MISFWVSESFKAIARAKSSFILSLVSMTIAILLITASFFSLFLAGKFEKDLKRNVSLNIFLEDSALEDQSDSLEQELTAQNYTASLKYIGKEEAAEIFIRETGEDFRKILDYNPLPASFVLTLKDQYVNLDSIETIAAAISEYPFVDEVSYKSAFIDKVLSFLKEFNKYLLAGTAVILFIAVYIVYSTVRLIINLRTDELETMKLVGAKISAIKMPVILNAVWIGLFAGLIASAVFLIFIFYTPGLSSYNIVSAELYLYFILLMLSGPVLGLLISWISLRGISLKTSSL